MPTSSGSLILAIKLTQQQKTTETEKLSLRMLCVYTKEGRGFKSEVKQLLPGGGELDLGHGSPCAEVVGQRCCISATGLHGLNQSHEVAFAKLLIPARGGGRPRFLTQSLQHKHDLSNGVGSSALVCQPPLHRGFSLPQL